MVVQIDLIFSGVEELTNAVMSRRADHIATLRVTVHKRQDAIAALDAVCRVINGIVMGTAS